MGYTITAVTTDGTVLIHDAMRSVEGYVALDAKLTKYAALTPDKLKFTLLPSHPVYKLEKMVDKIYVYRDGTEIYRGRVAYSKRDFYNRITYTCESDKAYLCDTIIRPHGFKGPITTKNSIRGYLDFLINEHNKEVGRTTYRAFTVGTVTVEDPNDYIIRASDKPMTTFKALNDKLIDTLGGYMRVRKSGNTYYLDYLADFSENSGQTIEFGVNLLDFAEETDGTSIANVVIPYGAKYDSDSEKYVSDYYVEGGATYTGNRLGASWNNRDYCIDADSATKYGNIWTTETWDDVTTNDYLKSKAEDLMAGSCIDTTYKISALDLSLTGASIEAIDVGQYVECHSAPHDVYENMLCTELDIDINDPTGSEITLGTEIKSLTSSVSRSGSASSASGTTGSDKADRALVVDNEEGWVELCNNSTNYVKVSDQVTLASNGTYIAVDQYGISLNGVEYSVGRATMYYGYPDGSYSWGTVEGGSIFVNIYFSRPLSAEKKTFTMIQQVFRDNNILHNEWIVSGNYITGECVALSNNYSEQGSRDFSYIAISFE